MPVYVFIIIIGCCFFLNIYIKKDVNKNMHKLYAFSIIKHEILEFLRENVLKFSNIYSFFIYICGIRFYLL